ncbi:unnamed protein product [Rotaria sp. Silwood2]|nr:unnamed protein product [Rotaria sp. Silwood2]CAF2839484.1 unnamed protein product [Rotaria sp. Silwood2]CAF2988045.1 unnamed protein product [Rotaria sp. Silwood2]CAF4621686.1 unnamed protein product [Rotaria sp. Silwood2]CAF4627551.1 unnamed protein product [Rotaria sp. Silwood2]
MQYLTYFKQATNECGTATSRLDTLVQTVPSSQDASLQVTASSKDYVSLVWYTYSNDSESELLSFIIEKHEEHKSI